MKTILLMLVLCLSGMAQELVGVSKGKAYYTMNPERTDNIVKFIGIISPYQDDKFVIDMNNHTITAFMADCTTYRYVARAYMNTIDGKVTKGIYEQGVVQAVKPQIIFKAIQKVCGNSDNTGYF